MAVGSTAGLPYIASDVATSGLADEWVITSMPGATEDSPRAVQVFVPSMVILVSTPERELATWLFLKHVSNHDSQFTWATNTGYYSIRTDVPDELSQDDFGDFLAPIFSRLEVGSAMLTDPDVYVYASPALPSYSPVRGLIDDAFAEVTTGGANVMDVLENLNVEANELHGELDG